MVDEIDNLKRFSNDKKVDDLHSAYEGLELLIEGLNAIKTVFIATKRKPRN